MTQTPFDQFSKQHLKILLLPLGTVNISCEVPGEALSIDLWFEPSAPVDLDRDNLRLLDKIAATPCLLEPFRNSPSSAEIRSCLQKLYWIHGDYQRQAAQNDLHLHEAALPQLWILAPSLSPRRAQTLGVKTDPDRWGAGIYFWAPVLKAAIIAINQLPETQDTLWLRLMGKGKTQTRAIEETLALPPDNAFRSDAVRLLETWKITIEKGNVQNREDAELMSTFMEVYEELLERDRKREEADKEAKLRAEEAERRILELQQQKQALQQQTQALQQQTQALQQEKEIARQRERYATLESLLQAKFGVLDESLFAMIQPLSQLPDEDYTQLLLQMSNLSREELLVRSGQ